MTNDPNVIRSVVDLVRLVEDMDATGTFFRGEENHDWTLRPSLGRYQREAELRRFDLERMESNALRVFKAESCAIHSASLRDDMEFLALAQHHGLPTRLIDWSLSPLVALYFAVEAGNDRKDAALYMFDPGEAGLRWHHEIEADGPPRALDSGFPVFDPKTLPFVYMSRHVDPRLRTQQGLFTVHHDFRSEFAPPGLRKYRIDKAHVRRIKFELMKLGIGQKLVYPDLGGLCRELKFRYFAGFPLADEADAVSTPMATCVDTANGVDHASP